MIDLFALNINRQKLTQHGPRGIPGRRGPPRAMWAHGPKRARATTRPAQTRAALAQRAPDLRQTPRPALLSMPSTETGCGDYAVPFIAHKLFQFVKIHQHKYD